MSLIGYFPQTINARWFPGMYDSSVLIVFINFLQLLIAILINWGICGILTATGTLTNDPNDVGYNTRTDARSRVLAEAPWINIPYPGISLVDFSSEDAYQRQTQRCLKPINSMTWHRKSFYEPRHYKTNKMNVRPTKTQISLGIRPV